MVVFVLQSSEMQCCVTWQISANVSHEHTARVEEDAVHGIINRSTNEGQASGGKLHKADG